MEKGKSRPRCNSKPPDVNNKELIEELLLIERERLKVAVEIEKERKIVFPETSIIIRDIIKLNDALNGKEKNTGKKTKPRRRPFG